MSPTHSCRCIDCVDLTKFVLFLMQKCNQLLHLKLLSHAHNFLAKCCKLNSLQTFCHVVPNHVISWTALNGTIATPNLVGCHKMPCVLRLLFSFRNLFSCCFLVALCFCHLATLCFLQCDGPVPPQTMVSTTPWVTLGPPQLTLTLLSLMCLASV